MARYKNPTFFLLLSSQYQAQAVEGQQSPPPPMLRGLQTTTELCRTIAETGSILPGCSCRSVGRRGLILIQVDCNNWCSVCQNPNRALCATFSYVIQYTEIPGIKDLYASYVRFTTIPSGIASSRSELVRDRIFQPDGVVAWCNTLINGTACTRCNVRYPSSAVTGGGGGTRSGEPCYEHDCRNIPGVNSIVDTCTTDLRALPTTHPLAVIREDLFDVRTCGTNGTLVSPTPSPVPIIPPKKSLPVDPTKDSRPKMFVLNEGERGNLHHRTMRGEHSSSP